MTSEAFSWRLISAVLSGYLLDAFLTWASEAILVKIVNGVPYYSADLVTQSFYTCSGAYFACVIAGGSRRIVIGLSAIGLPVGLLSLATSWRQEPHWYGLILWFSFIPSALLGIKLWNGRCRRRTTSALS